MTTVRILHLVFFIMGLPLGYMLHPQGSCLDVTLAKKGACPKFYGKTKNIFSTFILTIFPYCGSTLEVHVRPGHATSTGISPLKTHHAGNLLSVGMRTCLFLNIVESCSRFAILCNWRMSMQIQVDPRFFLIVPPDSSLQIPRPGLCPSFQLLSHNTAKTPGADRDSESEFAPKSAPKLDPGFVPKMTDLGYHLANFLLVFFRV